MQTPGAKSSDKSLGIPSVSSNKRSSAQIRLSLEPVKSKEAILIERLTRTPLLLLQLLFINGWYVVLTFVDEAFGYMMLKAVGVAFLVGTVHNVNAFLLWCGMQKTRAGLEARVAGTQ